MTVSPGLCLIRLRTYEKQLRKLANEMETDGRFFATVTNLGLALNSIGEARDNLEQYRQQTIEVQNRRRSQREAPAAKAKRNG